MTSVLGDHWGPQEQVRGREKREGKGGTEHRLGGTPSPDPVTPSPRVLKCYFHHGAAWTTWGYCCLLAALVSAWLHCISHK